LAVLGAFWCISGQKKISDSKRQPAKLFFAWNFSPSEKKKRLRAWAGPPWANFYGPFMGQFFWNLFRLALFLRFAAKEQANSKKNFENFSKISNGGGYCKWEII